MRPSSSRRLAAALALAFVILGAAHVRAEAPVFVTFSVQTPSRLAGYLKEKKPDIERQVAQWLAGRLATEFPYWDFTVVDAPGFPRLNVTLSLVGHDWKFLPSMQLQSGAPETALPSQIKWSSEDELDARGMPARQDFAAPLEATLENECLKARREELFTALRAAPLGTDARVAATGDVRIVLPLGWGRNRQIALSQFKLLYRTSNGIAAVYGNGVAQLLSYPAPPPTSGLVIVLSRFALGDSTRDSDAEPIAGHTQELPLWRPLFVFLDKFNPQGLVLPVDASDPAISIAPPR